MASHRFLLTFLFFFFLSSAFSVVCLWSYVRVCVRAYVLLRVYLQTRVCVCVCDRMYMRGRVCRVRLLVYRNVINLGAYSVLGYLYKLFYSSL